MKFLGRMFGGSVSPRQPVVPSGVQNRKINTSEILSRGRVVFPVADYGNYRSVISDLTVLSVEECGELGTGEKRLIMKSSQPRVITQDGRYSEGFDCFESSYWLMEKLRQQGGEARLVMVSHPFFSSDYAVFMPGENKTYSLTPGLGFDVSMLSRIGEIGDDLAKSNWEQRAIHPLALDLPGAVLGVRANPSSMTIDFFEVHIHSEGNDKSFSFLFRRQLFDLRRKPFNPPDENDALRLWLHLKDVLLVRRNIVTGSTQSPSRLFEFQGDPDSPLMGPAWNTTQNLVSKMDKAFVTEVGDLRIVDSGDARITKYE